MNAQHRQTPAAIFGRPMSPSILFSDMEGRITASGGVIHERIGSRVKAVLQAEQWRCHRPHPGKEAGRYQIDELRDMLVRAGVMP